MAIDERAKGKDRVTEVFVIAGIETMLAPRMDVKCRITRKDGSHEDILLASRIDTAVEVEYYQHGGMLHYVLRQALGKAA